MWPRCFPCSSAHRQAVVGMLTKTVKLMRWYARSLFCSSMDTRQVNGAFICLLLKMTHEVLKRKFYMWPIVSVAISSTLQKPVNVWCPGIRATWKSVPKKPGAPAFQRRRFHFRLAPLGLMWALFWWWAEMGRGYSRRYSTWYSAKA
jgi:hypothetical protein